jgi:hypothetical protein
VSNEELQKAIKEKKLVKSEGIDETMIYLRKCDAKGTFTVFILCVVEFTKAEMR